MGDILTQVSIFAVLLAFLVVGFLYKKKPQNMKEYALGRGNFSTSTLVATMIVTNIGGGSVIGFSAKLYQEGAWLLLALCAMPISYCLTSLFIIPRLSKYYGCCSIAEAMGRMYGVYARKAVGMVAFIFCIGVLAAQIKALHWVMEHVFNENAIFATMITLVVVFLYSSLGGVSAVIRTDVAQFVICLIVVPTIAYYVMDMSGGIASMVQSLPENKATLLPNGGNVLGVGTLALFYLLPYVTPSAFHRFLVAKDCKKNQTTLYVLAIIKVLDVFFVACVAFVALTKFPNIDPKETIFVVVRGLFSYQWAIIAFVIALIAVIASTADSSINTASVILINDVIKSGITDRQKLVLLKGVTILSGVVSTIVAFLFAGVLDIIWFFSKYYLIIVLIPFVVGIFLKELRKEAFWASAIMGVITFSILQAYSNLTHEIFLVGLVAALVAYFVAFFTIRKRKPPKYLLLRKACDGVAKRCLIDHLYACFASLFFYFASLVVICAYGIKDIASWGILTIMGILGCLLFFVSQFKYKNIIILFITWYCFIFFPMHFFLHHGTKIFFIISFFISTTLLMLVLEIKTFVGLILSGGVVASLLFGFLSLNFLNSASYLIYLWASILGVTAISFVYVKIKGIQASVFHKNIEKIGMSAVAEKKFQNILLKEDTITQIYFRDLENNILEYFYRVGLERGIELSVCCNLRQSNPLLNTKIPVSVFYKLFHSIIFNVLCCAKDELICINFYCDQGGTIQKIELKHGKYQIQSRLESIQDSEMLYPSGILRWCVVEESLKMVGGKIKRLHKKMVIDLLFVNTAVNRHAPSTVREVSQGTLPQGKATVFH